MNEMEVRNEYEKVIEVLAVRNPVTYLFAKNLRVEFVNDDRVPAYAGTDGKRIVIYPKWLELSDFEKVIVIVHEIYHNFLLHPIRMVELMDEYKDKVKPLKNLQTLINIVCDAKVNYLIRVNFLRKESDVKILNTYGFESDELEKESVEELFLKLLEQIPAIYLEVYGAGLGEGDLQESDDGQSGSGEDEDRDNDGSGRGGEQQDNGKGKVDDGQDGSGGREERIVLQEGKDKVQNAQSKEELEDALKNAVIESILSVKNAGKDVSALEEMLLEKLLKREVDWKQVIKQDIATHLKRNVILTWTKPNRRHEMLMGQREIARPRVYAFVDVSGSVWGDEIIKFMSEVVGLSKEISEMVLVTWDTKVTGEYRIKKQSDLSNVRFRGGGGTEFVPVLENYKGKIKAHDYMIVLTDTFWFDTEEAIKMLKQIRARKVLVRNNRNTDLDRAFNIVLELKGDDGDGI